VLCNIRMRYDTRPAALRLWRLLALSGRPPPSFQVRRRRYRSRTAAAAADDDDGHYDVTVPRLATSFQR